MLLVLDGLRTEVEREQELVRVPEDARTLQLLEQLDALHGLRPTLGDVAQRDDQIDVLPLDIGERGTESDGVSVHVRDERDTHGSQLTETPYAESAGTSSGSRT